MSDGIERVVFDCNIFAQTIITPLGSAGQCVEYVLEGTLRLFWTQYILAEIRRIPEKPTPRKLRITPARVEALIVRLLPAAHLMDTPPSVYRHPLDPKDSHYVDLAVPADARLIVSRDKHLLNLTNPSKPGAAEFMTTFPRLQVLRPEQLLQLLRK